MIFITPLNGILTALVACTVIWKFWSDRVADKHRHQEEIARINAESQAEAEKARSSALQATLDRELEGRKELNAAWDKVDAERSAVNTRFDAFQQSLIASREQAVKEQTESREKAIAEQQKMYEQIIKLRADLGNAQQQLGEAQGHIKAAEMETQYWKDKTERELQNNMALQARILSLEEKDRQREDARVTTTETIITTKSPRQADAEKRGEATEQPQIHEAAK